jgi:hypothetical protein
MEEIDWEAVSSQDILPILVKRLVLEGKYNEAENIIFDELNRNPSTEIYDIAKNFYNILLSKSDEELEKADFSREEIYMGLEDAGKIISSQSE